MKVKIQDENFKSIPEQILVALDSYKKSIDKFFMESRRGIYQKFALVQGGDFEDKLETESELYKCTYKFQNSLQEIIFKCVQSVDRFFIVHWAGSLLDMQIEETLNYLSLYDKNMQRVPKNIIDEFSHLKLKNFEIYLSDAKKYAEEQAKREQHYQSLIYRMRKDLEK